MQMQFHFQDGRPKQKRHRCRNPNKIDVNSLTGEERVQIINRRNARKARLSLGLLVVVNPKFLVGKLCVSSKLIPKIFLLKIFANVEFHPTHRWVEPLLLL